MTRLPLMGRTMPLIGARLASPVKQAAKHYLTEDHRAWSRAVIARAGGACQACGATNTRLYADHIQELRDGGAATDLANGQALCASCHTRKTARARAARQGEGG